MLSRYYPSPHYPRIDITDESEEFDEVYMMDTCGTCGTNFCGKTVDEGPHLKDCLWELTLDMSCYKPEDIEVTAENHKLIIAATKEHPAELLSLSRELKREFEVPADYIMDDLAVYFSSDGILVITVPCKKYRRYPIQTIGPARCFVKSSDAKDCDAKGSGGKCTGACGGKCNGDKCALKNKKPDPKNKGKEKITKENNEGEQNGSTSDS